MDGRSFDIRDERFWVGTQQADRDRAGGTRTSGLVVDEDTVRGALKGYLRL